MVEEVPRLLARTLINVPAIWLMTTFTLMLYGVLRRLAASLSWAFLVVTILLEMGWELQVVDQAVFNLSPFAYVHWTKPVISWLSIAMLIGVAVRFAGVGLFGLQRRDIG